MSKESEKYILQIQRNTCYRIRQIHIKDLKKYILWQWQWLVGMRREAAQPTAADQPNGGKAESLK